VEVNVVNHANATVALWHGSTLYQHMADAATAPVQLIVGGGGGARIRSHEGEFWQFRSGTNHVLKTVTIDVGNGIVQVRHRFIVVCTYLNAPHLPQSKVPPRFVKMPNLVRILQVVMLETVNY
jgi:hypothetical protein